MFTTALLKTKTHVKENLPDTHQVIREVTEKLLSQIMCSLLHLKTEYV